jgi:membrane protein
MDRVKHVVKTMFGIFNKQRVTRSAAAMSYYLTISIFPFLIVVYAILNSLNIGNENLYRVWEQIIPADVLKVILGYLRYVGGIKSSTMLIVGITVTLSSSSSAFGSLLSIMADIQGKSRFRGFWATVFSIVTSVGLLVIMYVSALVIVSGEWLLDFLEKNFGFARLLEIWQWVRFAILFLLMLAIIYLIYKVSAPKENKKLRRLPGALIASVLLVTVSAVFSRLIGSAANYPIVYGSLASFIILMLWIYICSIILIMGNVFNYAVYSDNPVVKKLGES